MIKIRNLTKVYPNITPLNDLSVDIKEGEVISIIGPSGTGKSTLLRCLNLLEKPTSGTIEVEGQLITDNNCDINKLRQNMGMVFQSFNLFSHLTIIENIMLAPVHLRKISKQQAYDEGLSLLKTVGLKEKAMSYPDELSGGQKQRVSIARMLAMKPKILLFDEPTSALDPTMVGEVLQVIKNLAKEKLTMLIVTHEMKFAKDVSTRIFYMDEGIIYEDGSPNQIFLNPTKQKTKDFINQAKSLSIKIESKDFDYIATNTQIEEYGRMYAFSTRKIYYLQLLFEEIVLSKLIKGDSNLKIDVKISYVEKKNQIEFNISYNGNAYNPLDELDDFSMKIIKTQAHSIEYKQEDLNKIIITTKMEDQK